MIENECSEEREDCLFFFNGFKKKKIANLLSINWPVGNVKSAYTCLLRVKTTIFCD